MFPQTSFIEELKAFIRFFARYVSARLLGWGTKFEKVKDIIVAFLVVKRGKYSQSFLNVSFFLLLSIVLIAGPIIIENNPFINTVFSQAENPVQSVLATDIYSVSLQTTISNKPRDRIIEHTVEDGETLDSIASRYDISIDTIKWENNLKNDTIKPNDRLRILPITGVAHKVKSGESIYTIAKKYGIDAQAIANFPFNEFVDLDTFGLEVGQIVYVPDGTIQQAVPTRRGPNIPPRSVNVVAGAAGSGHYIWPTTGSITQYPIYYHMAVDIANRSLPGVIAADTGTVSFSGCIGGGYGCHVIIDHGNGFKTLYGHLSAINVEAGQNVTQGQSIGRMGSTGRSTGPHLHFEVRKDGALQNPLSYLP
jgi:murein DD-endopeptidase MepM/ murein hydrolase activator NlpD